MAIRIADAGQVAQKLEWALRKAAKEVSPPGRGPGTLERRQLEQILTQIRAESGPEVAAAVRATWEAAREDLGREPRLEEVVDEFRHGAEDLRKVAESGDDLFADGAEAAKAGRTASVIYAMGDSFSPVSPPTEATTSVSPAQAASAYGVVTDVLSLATELYRPGVHTSFSDAIREAAKKLGHPEAAKVVIAAVGRINGDGTLPLVADGTGPSIGFDHKLSIREAKRLVSRTLDALGSAERHVTAADGVDIVDLAQPSATRSGEMDGVTTDLELARSRAANDEVANAYFRFASMLKV